MAIEKSIPNFLTLCNMFCGFLGIFFCYEGDMVTGALFVFIGALFDLFDGMVARWLNVHSPIGKDLDSLSDLITFGMLPAVILHLMLRKASPEWLYWFHVGDIPGLSLLPFLVLASATVRLAKFNVDTTQSNYFKGLPTPSAGMFVAALPLATHYGLSLLAMDEKAMAKIVMNEYVIVGIILFLTWIMNANVRLFSLKRKNLKWGDNKDIYILFILGLVAFVFLLWAAIPLIIFLYVILSLIFKPKDNEVQSAN